MTIVVEENTIRFSILTESLLRIEEDKGKVFENRPTTMVVNRDFKDVDAEVIRNHNGHKLEIITSAFHLYYEGGDLSPLTLFVDIKKSSSLYHNRWYFGSNRDEKNLKGTIRTLDRANGEVPLPDGIMSKNGSSVLDDSQHFIFLAESDSFLARRKDIVDEYLFCYGRDYQNALTDFYHLTGFPPLIPRFALGNWWSRFYPYSQKAYQKLMINFENRDVPISVSVLDMDWHKRDIPQKYGSGWTGYSWNRDLFPNPRKLLTWLHDHNKAVTLNVHPAAGIRAFEDQYQAVAKELGLDTENDEPAKFDLENPKFRKAYFEKVHHTLEKEGVDFWWLDWQQGIARDPKKMDPLWLLNYYHYKDNKKGKGDGLILSRFAGLGSHRYPIGFSGDTVITWDSLDFQPYFTSTASNVGYTWWSHDIGGHMKGSFDGELATRWLQFGVFSPINRLHSSNNIFSGKEPWNYRKDFEESQEKFLRLRHSLLPYIDSANFDTHTKGIPICRPLYYIWPDNEEAYQAKNEYAFGPSMLVSPITKPHDKTTQTASSDTWLPEGKWVDYFTHLPYDGATRLKTYRKIDTLPVFVRQGSIVVTNPDYMSDTKVLPKNIEIEVFPGQDVSFDLHEHLGDKVATTKYSWKETAQSLDWEIEDPSAIIPSGRSIKVKIQKASFEAVVSELKERLQQSYMDFNLKQKLYDAFVDSDYNYSHFLNLLTEVEDTELRNSLSEVAYIRNSYN